MNDTVIDPEASYYISGPMSGLPEYNYPYFNRVVRRLRRMELTVYSPTEIGALPTDLEDTALWDWCISKCIEMMDKCDAIVLLSGWPTSRGAKLELDVALKRNFQVYFYLDNPGRLVNMSRMLPNAT